MITRNGDTETRLLERAEGGSGTVLARQLVRILPVNVRLLSEMTLHDGDSVGEHVHEGETEIYIITGGSAVYTDDGEEVTLHAGDTAVCASGHSHAIRPLGAEPLRFTAVIVLE